MKDTNPPLLTVAELEALLQVWGGRANQSVDRIFPIKLWFVLSVAVGYCGWLLFAVRSRMIGFCIIGVPCCSAARS